MRTKVMCIGLMFVFAGAARGATYYVDYDVGIDSNTGVSMTTPWRHSPGMRGALGNAAACSLQPGDRMVFRGGVIWPASALPLTVNRSGSAGLPIQFTVDTAWYAGSSWARPVFDAEGTDFGSSSFMVTVNGRRYVDIEWLELKNHRYDRSYWAEPVFYFISSDNINVRNCYIHHWAPLGTLDGTAGFLISSCQSMAMEDNVIYGSDSGTSGRAFYLHGTNQNLIIRNNDISHVPNGIIGGGTNVQVVGNHLHDLFGSFDPDEHENAIMMLNGSGVVRDNIIHDLPADVPFALALAGIGVINDWTAYNNLIYRCEGQQIVVEATAASATQNDYRIYNNTVVTGVYQNSVRHVFYPTQVPLTSLIIKNNVFVNRSDAPVVQAASNIQSLQIDSNFYDTAGSHVLRVGTNDYDLAEARLLGYDVHSSTGESNLTADFKPNGPSNPAVDAGEDLSAVFTSDLAGAQRPQGAAWDIGAYEYCEGGGCVTPIPTASPTPTPTSTPTAPKAPARPKALRVR